MSRLILILSGDTFEIRTLIMSLEVEGLKIARCSNSDQLWEHLTEGRPRALALIADLKAPWDDMRSIFRRFRASERGRRTPILIIGDPADISKQDTIESSGVNPEDFFPPPIDGVALVRRISSIPEGGEEPPEAMHATATGIRGAVIGAGGIPDVPVAHAASAPSAIPPEGSLALATPARLLTTLGREKATGRLELELPDGRSELFLDKGQILQLKTRGAAALGRLVVETGRAPEAAVARLGDPGSLELGQLIGAGVLGPHQAFDLLKEQAVVFLKANASQRKGSYRWRAGEMPGEQAFPVDIPLHRTLLDGLVENPPVPHPLPPKLAQSVPTLTPQGRGVLDSLSLTAVESRLVKELDGHARLWNIAQQLSGGDQERAAHLEALIIGLRDIGVVALKAAADRSRGFGGAQIPRARPEPPPEAPRVDAQLEQLLAEVTRVQAADPFDILGVGPDVTTEEVRRVFVELSKRYHPDKFFGKSEEIRAAVEEIFKHVQDAYTIASDPEEREAFRKMRDAGTDHPITEEDENRATIVARQAQLYLKNRNYGAARDLYAQAADLNPLERDYQVQGVWAAHLASPKDVVRNLNRLHHLVSHGHETADAFYYFGVMLKSGGDADRAEKAFRKALSLKPDYLEPQRELRLMEMRQRKAEEAREKEQDKRSGLFSGFRKP